jgi:malto-oligosyltrehalose trehalohydrolase
MIIRRHTMPFGAEITEAQDVRFALWAPGAQSVHLCLEGPHTKRQIELAHGSDGWYTLELAEVGVGTRYRYLIDGKTKVPDPTSRFQPDDVHGASQVIDPLAFEWTDGDWKGRPWEEVVLYELHVGTFTPQGTYAAIKERLDYLVDLGVTAIELMPVADFPGARNWGYDGVLSFAPDSVYGRPEDLKDLIQSAHAKGLMVFLDVVYNHFGPDGNYLHCYAGDFFTDRHHTPWGSAINFDGAGSPTVRQFFIHNALYWLEEYHFDGLRLDAVHAIIDDTDPDILDELADAVARGPGLVRRVHVVLENDQNAARYLERDAEGRPRRYCAQWNDDIHHALHTTITGEAGGYYADYADTPVHHLGRCLTQGFAFQNEPSPFRDNAVRGESTRGVALSAFVNFLQNHDQVGNRALGERIHIISSPEALRAATAILLLAPSPPLLFMGQEWAASAPFLFFCDFGPELASAVTQGRRREFARFPEFSDPQARQRIPDPNNVRTFTRSKLDWDESEKAPHRDWLQLHQSLLGLRRAEIVPRLAGVMAHGGQFKLIGDRGLRASWVLNDGAALILSANLDDAVLPDPPMAPGRILYATHGQGQARALAPWSVAWNLEPRGGS